MGQYDDLVKHGKTHAAGGTDPVTFPPGVRFVADQLESATIAGANGTVTGKGGFTGTLYTNDADLFEYDSGSSGPIQANEGGCYVVLAGCDSTRATRIELVCEELISGSWTTVQPVISSTWSDNRNTSNYRHALGVWVRNFQSGGTAFRFSVSYTDRSGLTNTFVTGGGLWIAKLADLPATLAALGAE